MNPPRHAVVLSLDEKCQIKALERTRPGRSAKRAACSHTHDYVRHGTTTLFAALDIVRAPWLAAACSDTATTKFLHLLNTVEATIPAGKTIHVVLDNY